jgi:predicted nucleotidyltransferase
LVVAYEEVKQPKALYEKKLLLRTYLYEMLKKQFSQVDLYIVGSSVNGLAGRESDTDMCLVFNNLSETMDQTVDALHLLHEVRIFLSENDRFADFDLISAKVPILKFKDVNTDAVLPDEKGCTPIYEKLYADMIAPIKHKMSTGESQGVKERKITVEEPTWLKQIQLEQAKDKPKTITPPVQPQIQKVEPPKTIEPPKPVEAPKTVEPAKPVEAPKQQPVSPPKPVEPAKPVIVQPPVKPEPAKPKIAPLIVPKVPKKTKIETPQPTQVKGSASNGSGSTGSGSTGSGSPPTQPVQPTPQQPALKVPTGPTQFVGQKKKINIFNQK